MTITLNGTTGITTPAVTNSGAYTGDGVVFADGTPSNTLVTTTGGNVGIGTSSPSFINSSKGLQINDSTSSTVRLTTPTASLELISATAASYVYATSNTPIVFGTNNTERMRIDSIGNLLVGTTNPSDIAGVGFKICHHSNTPYVTQTVDTTNAGAGTYHLFNINATNNGYRFYVRSNGGISNYSGNNANLSDERTKTNIELSGSYLDKICAIPVKLFNYKDEPEGEQRTLGVIAQDVEAVAPEFVNNDGWEGTAPEDGVPLKTIYTTDMMFGLMKAIQEQQAIIQSQADTISAMEARLTALENK